VCRSNDVPRDPRWPAWAQRAAVAGARSLVSVRLSSGGGHPLGALNLYSHRIGAWDEQAYDLALLFATHAALALDAAHAISGLRAALASRHQIGVAQGILMQQHRLGLAQSFEVLQRFSNNSNTKLSDVAARIIADLDPSQAAD
jgi:GAF domain-containing protein